MTFTCDVFGVDVINVVAVCFSGVATEEGATTSWENEAMRTGGVNSRADGNNKHKTPHRFEIYFSVYSFKYSVFPLQLLKIA